jgi:intein/homing endonuclease/RecA/RadA recombinase
MKKTKETEEKKITSSEILDSFLKQNSEDHYNFEETVDYKVSSGSLQLDLQLGGGFGPGLHRFCGINEGGKEQPVSEPVLTPTGWRKIGELEVGDEVIDSQGKPQKVLAIYPQGVKDVYEVKFDDGSATRCGIEHLWETSNFTERHRRDKSVKSLGSIMNTLRYGSNINHSVRIVKPIDFVEKNLKINPYLMGVLLGDGGITQQIVFTNTDEELISKINDIITRDYSTLSIKKTSDNGISYRISSSNSVNVNPLITQLKEFGLFGQKSETKFVPEEYKTSSIEQRLSLLHGLIDTDGYVNKKKSEILFYSVSEKLADDVIDIVRSLGGMARKRFKQGSYKNKEGKRIICKNCFIISFYLPDGINPCSLGRKLDNVSPRVENFCHFIKEVNLVGQEESVCIKVSSLDSLYVTKDYILTHNTSEALEVMKNFLVEIPNSKGFYIKAEGRLSPEMQKRSGIKFVFSAEEWVVGTCFVFESNIYETVVNAMRQLVSKNEEAIKFCFLLDAVDGLIAKNDMDKSFEESAKVAGGAVIAATFMKKLSIALAKRGHMAIFISQVRADIKLDPYSKAPIRQTSATGGNALLHFANWILEFEPRFKGDLILKNAGDKSIDLEKNPPIGHWAKVTVKKSPNEKTNLTIPYPIRYGRTGGKSIWIEKEIVDLLLAWELVNKSGAWFSPSEDFLQLLAENSLTFPPKIQGEASLFKSVEEDSALLKFLIEYFRKMISNEV